MGKLEKAWKARGCNTIEEVRASKEFQGMRELANQLRALKEPAAPAKPKAPEAPKTE